MYQQISINRVILDTGITATAARLLYEIDMLISSARANHNNAFRDRRGVYFCYAGKEWFAQKLNKSMRTIARAIRELKDAGLIESKKTIRNSMIYVTYYGGGAMNGSCKRAENGTWKEGTHKNIKNQKNISINLSSIPTPGAEANTENSEQGRASYAAATTEAAEDEGQRRGRTAGQVESTGTTRSRNDQRQEAQTPAAGRIGTDGRHHGEDQRAQGVQLQGRDEATRREVRENLRNNCDMEYSANHCSTPDEIEDYERKSAVIDMVADAASVIGGFVKVSGAALTISQWLNVIMRDVNETVLHDAIIRVLRADAFGKVKNFRAYMLATLYNTAQQSRINGERYSLAF